MGRCFDCGKTNPDESLELAKQQAKKIAIENEMAQAIYKEGTDYYIIAATTAFAGNYPVITVVSGYS